MAKRIIEMVIAKSALMRGDRKSADQNAMLASAAVHGGVRSVAWRNYMMQFVEQDPRGTPVDPKQLERLLGTDGTLGDSDLDMRRAYLVGNGPCGSTTPDRLPVTVNSIDIDLDGGCLPSNAIPLPDGGGGKPPRKAPKKGGKW